MKKKEFLGPLFIVGIPRSGTKLLRDLLNRNPRIGIPIHESGFIPYLVEKYGNPPRITNELDFEQFYNDFSNSGFYLGYARKGLIIEQDYLRKKANIESWQSVFETIFRFYSPKGEEINYIWGDKTPQYLIHMPDLKEIFPSAKFIHIIRDPRDCVLSHLNTWGKSIYRAAENWRIMMIKAQETSRQFNKDEYLEVSYENVISDPISTLQVICTFLDCEFSKTMLSLDRFTENLGTAKGQTSILSKNRHKYLDQLSASSVKRIEEIVYPGAKDLGYVFENNVEFKPVNPHYLKILKLYDGLKSIRFFVKHDGISIAFRRLWYSHSRSSW